MPNYYKFKKKLLEGSIPLVSGNIKIALVRSSYILDLNHEFFSSISGNEIVDAGYTAGGKALVNKVVNQVSNKFYYDADDLVWTFVGTVAINKAILYLDTGVAGTSPLISIHQADPERIVIASTYTFKPNTLGLLELQ
jgi:hypothetical protein